MIGRFIHDQNIRKKQQRSTDRQPFPPSSREHIHSYFIIHKFSPTQQGMNNIKFFNLLKVFSLKRKQ